MKKSTYQERLRLAMEYADLTQQELAKRVGVRQQSIQYLLSKGRSSRRNSEIAKACGVDPDWLATGEGETNEMRVLARKQQIDREAQRSRDHVTLGDESDEVDAEADPRYSTIPLYQVDAAAGGGASVYTEAPNGSLAFLRSWINDRGLDPRRLVAVEVAGDSMAPEYKDGDVIVVDTREAPLKSGFVYVFRVDHELRLKRLYRNLNGSITIRSDNRDDPQFQHDETLTPADLDQVQIIGEVVWRGG